jgi:acetyl-CoA acetyltransferase
MTDAFVLDGVRTPVGRYGGSPSHIRTVDLLGRTLVAACARVGVPRALGVCVGSGQGVALVLEDPSA